MILSCKISVVTDGSTSVKINSGSEVGEAPPWQDTLKMSCNTMKLVVLKTNFFFWKLSGSLAFRFCTV